MSGYTRLLLTGRALHAIGSAAELARDLQPAVLVLEDVDLVAEDRSFGHGSSPVLFDLLDAMDGAAADADLLFVTHVAYPGVRRSNSLATCCCDDRPNPPFGYLRSSAAEMLDG